VIRVRVQGGKGRGSPMGLIRFALAMVVVFGHLPGRPYFPMPGADAVQAFFVISGFYTALILDGKYTDLGLFYTNRALRIFPMYWLVVLISTIAIFGFGAFFRNDPADMASAYGQIGPALALGFANLAILGQDVLYFLSLDPASGAFGFNPEVQRTADTIIASAPLVVPQAWSLAIELMFYAVAPFILRGGWKLMLAIAAISLALRLGIPELIDVRASRWPDKAFPAALCLFMIGMLGYQFRHVITRAPKQLGLIAQIVILALVLNYNSLFEDERIGRLILLPLIAISLPLIFEVYRNSRIDRWMGDLSYPIYIVHILVISLANRFIEGPAPLAIVAGTLAASTALLIIVDRPVDAWRQRRAARGAQSDAYSPSSSPASSSSSSR
jgi:peptidoglycan/LPS O-acetylase OafA/YrhL